MKKIFILIIILILSGCSNKDDDRVELSNDNQDKVVESDSIDLGSKEEIKSKIYKKYFQDINQSVKYDENLPESKGRMEVEKVDDNRKIFIGNGSYLSFLPEKCQIYLDYNYDLSDFTLAYIVFEGESVNNKVLEEDLIVEFIKNNENIEVNQENLNGEEKIVYLVDDEYKDEVISSVYSLATNPIFSE